MRCLHVNPKRGTAKEEGFTDENDKVPEVMWKIARAWTGTSAPPRRGVASPAVLPFGDSPA